jgi:DNA-binding NarL/FixJ family response regulator
MLADDHATVREGLRLLLQAEPDMEVVDEVDDGRLVVQAVTSSRPDVAVLDLSMPGVGGIPAARALKRECPQVAIVALTRHDEAAFVTELMHAGAAAYVLKQSPSAVLLRAIREAAAGGQFLDPALPLRPERSRRAGAPRATERENQVLRMLAQGYSNKEIAAALAISVKTVEVHKANVMRKLSLRGRTDIVRYALLNGWLSES